MCSAGFYEKRSSFVIIKPYHTPNFIYKTNITGSLNSFLFLNKTTIIISYSPFLWKEVPAPSFL